MMNISLDPDSRRFRAKQVGMLMQAYRHAYGNDGRKSRLSQEGLLKLMGQVDPVYLERYNHSTVARWESGATRPSKERLEVFGKALNLSAAEVEGLISLAGLHEIAEGPQSDAGKGLVSEVAAEPIVSPVEASPELVVHLPTHTVRITRYILTKFGLPGLAVAGVGYMLARLGWNAGWIMSLYVATAVLLVLVQGFLRVRRSHEIREVYFLTVFFLISGNLLQAPATKMDPYGFYAMGEFANTPYPYLLATLVNLGLALLAGVMFDFLWRWQYSSNRGFKNVYHRAAVTAFPPLLFVYVFSFFICCFGMWIFLMLVFSITGGTFMAILAMRDKDVVFRKWERKLLLQAAMGVILILTAVGAATILILYLEPSPLAIPDHTLIRSWEIDFGALGYSPDELLERYRVGAVWSSLATLIYMIIVLGGSLLVTIYRLDEIDSNGAQSEAATTGATELPGHHPQVDSHQELLNASGQFPTIHSNVP